MILFWSISDVISKVCEMHRSTELFFAKWHKDISDRTRVASVFNHIVAKAKTWPDGFDIEIPVDLKDAFEKACKKASLVICQINEKPCNGFITYGTYPNSGSMAKQEAAR